MYKLSRKNILTAFTMVAGVVAAIGYAASLPEVGGAALGAAMVLVAPLIHSVARELRIAQSDARTMAVASKATMSKLDASVKEMATQTDKLLRAQRKTIRAAEAQGDRIEQRTDAMTRRIIADVNALRLEAADRHTAAAD